MKPLVALISALGALCAAPLGEAAPPSLVSVGQTDRHPTATWTLGPGVQARLVEVATATTQATDGHFFTENTVVRSNVDPTLTNWVYRSQLEPGTYYVHVAGFDPNCDGCPRREWSNILSFTIPGATQPATGGADERPRIRGGQFTLLSRVGRPTWRVRLEVCDDGASALRLFVRQNGSTSRHALGRITGCERVTRTFRAPASFNGRTLRVGVWTRDSAGTSTTEAIRKEWAL
jgi:hypothetical protein